jgi:hypothetical protein
MANLTSAANQRISQAVNDNSWSHYPSGASSVSYTANALRCLRRQRRRKSKTIGGATILYVTDADNREVLEDDGSTGGIKAA